MAAETFAAVAADRDFRHHRRAIGAQAGRRGLPRRAREFAAGIHDRGARLDRGLEPADEAQRFGPVGRAQEEDLIGSDVELDAGHRREQRDAPSAQVPAFRERGDARVADGAEQHLRALALHQFARRGHRPLGCTGIVPYQQGDAPAADAALRVHEVEADARAGDVVAAGVDVVAGLVDHFADDDVAGRCADGRGGEGECLQSFCHRAKDSGAVSP